MFERIWSSPDQTALVAVEIDVSWALSPRTTSSCSRMALSAAADRRRVDLDLALDERRQREQPGEPDRRLEGRRLRRLRVDDAVDVVADQGERRDPARRVGRA